MKRSHFTARVARYSGEYQAKLHIIFNKPDDMENVEQTRDAESAQLSQCSDSKIQIYRKSSTS